MSLDLVEKNRSGGLGPRMDLGSHGFNSPSSVFLLADFPRRSPAKDQLTLGAAVKITVMDARMAHGELRPISACGSCSNISFRLDVPLYALGEAVVAIMTSQRAGFQSHVLYHALQEVEHAK